MAPGRSRSLLKKIARNEKVVESKQLAVDIQNALAQGLRVVSWREMNRAAKQAPISHLQTKQTSSSLRRFSLKHINLARGIRCEKAFPMATFS